MFKIGEKVVCVDDSPPKQIKEMKHLTLNEMYTIRGFKDFPNNGLGILLEEIVNDSVMFVEGLFEPLYDIKRFRKLDHDFADNILAQIKEEVMCNI